MANEARSFRSWAHLAINLSNNWITLAGVILITTAGIFWLFLLPTFLRGHVENPYLGILLFMVLPAGFFTALVLMPLGIWLRLRRMRREGHVREELPPIDLRNVAVRRLLMLLVLTTFANAVIGGQMSYRAVTYMESVTFCGLACHTVMQPEYTAYQDSPHARVKCVECHIGEGASWFVKSKLDGVRQVVAVVLDSYQRPIPTPIETLRPARETCEECHWPQKFGADRVRILTHFETDEANSASKTVLLMRIAHGATGPGIHGAHLDPGVEIWYRHADEKRQEIPWVEMRKNGKTVATYLAEGATAEEVEKLPMRLMDCLDCHTRPSHAFQLPGPALDQALARGEIPADLPYIKKVGLEALEKQYSSHGEAEEKIVAAVREFYSEKYPHVSATRAAEIGKAGAAIAAIYNRNNFPSMKVTWGTYPDHIGHEHFPGCFRCHDWRTGSNGNAISQDCSTCHQVLAMGEEKPEILNQLGLLSND
jgi:nitrate/TMAO reductase-like tetraheme cytochrome c subunit